MHFRLFHHRVYKGSTIDKIYDKVKVAINPQKTRVPHVWRQPPSAALEGRKSDSVKGRSLRSN